MPDGTSGYRPLWDINTNYFHEAWSSLVQFKLVNARRKAGVISSNAIRDPQLHSGGVFGEPNAKQTF